MKSTIKVFIAFSSGLVIGGICGGYYSKMVYEEKASQEIQQARDLFSKKLAEINETAKEEASRKYNTEDTPIEQNYITKSSIEAVDYHTIYKPTGKTMETDLIFPEVEEEVEIEDPVVEVITREEFMATNDYDKHTYILYSDNVWTDDTDTELDHLPSEELGKHVLNEFLEGESSEMYVRNNFLNAEYELWRSPDSYSNVVGNGTSDE